MMHLHSPITDLPRVGKATASLLKKLGLDTVHDLLFYLPFRYDDFSQSKQIDDLIVGEATNIQGEIELISNKKSPRRRLNITEALISDESGTIKAIWFNQPFLTKNFRVGDKVSLAGRVTESYGQLSLVSPVIEKIRTNETIHTSGLIPNYHLTSDLTQKQLRFFIKEVLHLSSEIKDWLPTEIKKRLNLIDLPEALKKVHFPKDRTDIISGQKRLAFTKLFLRQIKSQMIKRELSARQAVPLSFLETETKKFVSTLPFQLTNAQRKAAWEILQDISRPEPMSRLLAGDVGSGKTIVVIMALLNAVKNGKQAALMVPTEILAEQHYQTISKFLAVYGLKISLLTRSTKLKDRRAAAEADIIIGTQAVIQDKVSLPNLALAVVDEQHRFGVSQRKKILDFQNGNQLTPHFLSLTATPIPRSLALAIYGDLDLSMIGEKPKGRKPIITKIVLEAKRSLAYDFIRQKISGGEQAFVICPLIEASDKLGVRSAKEEWTYLSKQIFPEFKIGLLHGKMKATEKEKIMTDFLNNKLQILVSTSVIEVGIDVPNATLMLIEGAERFGLAQLHQFRGRVGRSEQQSYCLLFPTKEVIDNDKTLTRLEALTTHQDGLELSKIDLKLRGSGELYGTGQSGFPELQIAFMFDYAQIKKAQAEAAALVASDPDLSAHPEIRAKLGEWEKAIHLE